MQFEDVSEAVIVKAAHGVEVGRQCITVSSLKLFNQALYIGGDNFFRRLPLLRLFGVFAGGGNATGCAIAEGRCAVVVVVI